MQDEFAMFRCVTIFKGTISLNAVMEAIRGDSTQLFKNASPT